MKNKFLIRLDDACPTMDSAKWLRIEGILEQFDIKPMVGIIPANNDPKMFCDSFDDSFWSKVRKWQDKNWTMALHGYDHVYITKEGGLHPLNYKSEFAGVPLKIQKEKLSKGYEILAANGVFPEWFFAPSHTFDLNTIEALKAVTPIRKISDTFACYPYKAHGMIFYPQQVGNFRNIKLKGAWTFCFHPNTMSEKDFDYFESFIKSNKSKFTSFKDDEIVVCNKKRFIDILASKLFFFLRDIKKQ